METMKIHDKETRNQFYHYINYHRYCILELIKLNNYYMVIVCDSPIPDWTYGVGGYATIGEFVALVSSLKDARQACRNHYIKNNNK